MKIYSIDTVYDVLCYSFG